jgi:hypothetical protein
MLVERATRSPRTDDQEVDESAGWQAEGLGYAVDRVPS